MVVLAGGDQILQDMFDPKYRHFDLWQNVLTMCGFLLVFLLLDFLVFKLFKRKFVPIFTLVCEAIIFASWLFNLSILMYVFIVILAVGIVIFFIANINDCRDLIANSLIGKASVERFFSKKDKYKGESLFDREALYQKIEQAVLAMSKSKTGALITFEKKDSLNEIMKSGTVVEAPVTPELLETIFYNGTRLHDGAVVIRKDYIIAASVYYTPTTRPLTGKYGSRHRAAIGISEITDAVTVVVSEETGRISITYKGQLTPISPDMFVQRLAEFMAIDESKVDE